MRKITPEEIDQLARKRGGGTNPVTAAIYRLEVGESLLVNKEDYPANKDGKGPGPTAYHHASRNQKKFKIHRTKTGGWIIMRLQ